MIKNKINKAIISVYDKDQLEILVPFLIENKIEVYSTGGTYKYLKELDSKINIVEISKYSGFPEILNGRVKTLNAKIFAGILTDKNNLEHLNQIQNLNLSIFDLAIINLYPFEKVIESTKSSHKECIENIDIGGPSIIRAAAKNYSSVTILTNPKQYKNFVKLAFKNEVDLNQRLQFAKEAFKLTSYYDSIISEWFINKNTSNFNKLSCLPLKKMKNLRYGENPHQSASLYQISKNNFYQISGKDLSFNNFLDLEVAFELANEFSSFSCVIVKHGNPCGVSVSSNQKKSYKNALGSDKISAFGGVVAFNKKLEIASAKEIIKIFTEIVVAPDFSPDAIKELSKKENLIIIRLKFKKRVRQSNKIKSTNNFILIQENDHYKISKNDLKIKTSKKVNNLTIKELLFAFTVTKYVNSNAIVISKNHTTLGIGCGQTNRLDASLQAMCRSNSNLKKLSDKQNIVLASDGFFPFPDIVKACKKNKISSIIQPGGSKKDLEIIKESEKSGITMVFTNFRHFKH